MATAAANYLLPSAYSPIERVLLAVVVVSAVVALCFTHSFGPKKYRQAVSSFIGNYWRFAYACFFKPHSGDSSRNQQDALESFYKAQASVYDATRERLLRGREEMLGLVAAQVKERILSKGAAEHKPIWCDIGGGTGYNIEKMGQFLDVANTFEAVYLVDFSPSLCAVAEDRFVRLGWKNVKVVCGDARHFRLAEHHTSSKGLVTHDLKADVMTMSYSLSMIPEFYPVVDSISSQLASNGVIGVADFYVQSEIDYQSRNYTGGEIDRHCMWISRVFWRAWFEQDRVGLEAARRDYLEYRFGTVLSFNARCHMLGLRIPYYVWVGCSKDSANTETKIAELNAAATESPFLTAIDMHTKALDTANNSDALEVRSKAYESAIVNLRASLPLPAAWYQSHHWRIYYDHSLQKHRQFNDEYIYAFTWEDARVDARLLNINSEDVIMAITSAGDNILAYALERPKRIHAIDLNPNQNHLLELKLAAFTALEYEDVWKIFGEGCHPEFRKLLINKLSPHLSSGAFQFWLHEGPKTFGPKGTGLYFTGGSRHALSLSAKLFKFFNLQGEVDKLCNAKTLNEQKEIWYRSIRRVLLSKLLSWAIVSSKSWLWKALGVPPAQRDMIERDHAKFMADARSGDKKERDEKGLTSGQAIWNYGVNTLDPVIDTTLLSEDNHYYLLCLLGHYTKKCHPEYLAPKAHQKLSRPGAFDGLRIHTDEICEVVERMTPGTLTIAVVMDSMDWFHPTEGRSQVEKQVKLLRRSLKDGGRVMLRSAGTEPWYVSVFEEFGFKPKRAAVRLPGTCIDRVNMYASTWILTKLPDSETRKSLDELSIGEAMQSQS